MMDEAKFTLRINDCSKKVLSHNTLAQLFFRDNWGRECCIAYVFYKEKVDELNKDEVLDAIFNLAIKPNVHLT